MTVLSLLNLRRRSEETPWGILFTGARAVDSATGNEGSGIKVGIIDSGVDCNGDDLSGQVRGGYDFADGIATGCAIDGSHGTAVAGIIAAAANAGGVIGMAPQAALYSYLVTYNDGNLLSETALAEAINSATADSVKVINLSISNCGADASSTVRDAIADAESAGVIFVASAGNGAAGGCTNTDPVSGFARVTGVIAVSRFDTSLVITANGQYGSSIVLSAPSFVDTDSLGFGSPIFHNFPGTSAAVPHVSGAFALARASGLSRSAAITELETYTRLGPGQTGKDNYYGYGQLDVAAILGTPRVDSLSWCTDGNITSDTQIVDGACTVVAHTTYGAPPVQAQFKVITSVLHDATVYGWGLATTDIAIHPNTGADSLGYTMTVIAYVRDSPFHRSDFASGDSSVVVFYVCNLSGGTEFIRKAPRPVSPSLSWINPDYPAGCNPDLAWLPIVPSSTSRNISLQLPGTGLSGSLRSKPLTQVVRTMQPSPPNQ
jgi:subtilisin